MKELIELLVVIAWLYGIVLAKGFFSTFFAVICPLWSLYLVIEKVMA